MWSRVALYEYLRYSLHCGRILWAKPCSCSHCCSCHLWFYDSGRFGESRNSNPKGTRPVSSTIRFQNGAFVNRNICAPEENACTVGYLRYQVFTTGSNFNYLSKGWFPLSRNFYVRTCVKFKFANKIEAMYERSHVSVKVETRSTSRLAQHLISCLYFYLFTWFKFTCVKYVCNTDVFIRAPLY